MIEITDSLRKQVRHHEGVRTAMYLDSLGKATIGEVLVNMCFQLGKNGVSKFKNMFRCMKEGDWEGAAFQMKDSRWHKQTTNRCEELASIVANYKETE
jgi:GH24 family phage-related lysozyme (muramidase)